jgi:hypothetical protein
MRPHVCSLLFVLEISVAMVADAQSRERRHPAIAFLRGAPSPGLTSWAQPPIVATDGSISWLPDDPERDGEPLYRWMANGRLTRVGNTYAIDAISADGRAVAAGNLLADAAGRIHELPFGIGGLSSDGRVALVGRCSERLHCRFFRREANGRLVELTAPNSALAGSYVTHWKVSATGDFFAGVVHSGNSGIAVRWDRSGRPAVAAPSASTNSWLRSMSPDGTRIVGFDVVAGEYIPYVWDERRGATRVAPLAGDEWLAFRDISQDHTAILFASCGRNRGPCKPALWREETGLVPLPIGHGYAVYDRFVMPDGRVIIGEGPGGTTRWEEVRGLEMLPGDRRSLRFEPEDGSVTLGPICDDECRLFRWTLEEGLEEIRGPRAGDVLQSRIWEIQAARRAEAVVAEFCSASTDDCVGGHWNRRRGTVAIPLWPASPWGTEHVWGSECSGEGCVAAVWSEGRGLERLALPGAISSGVHALDQGLLGVSCAGQDAACESFLWTPEGGVRSLAEAARASGARVRLAPLPALLVFGISGDKRWLVGWMWSHGRPVAVRLDLTRLFESGASRIAGRGSP